MEWVAVLLLFLLLCVLLNLLLPQPPASRWRRGVQTSARRVTRRLRRQTVEHPFATLKAWMGATHFQMRRLRNVRTEMALHVLAYNIKRMIGLVGVGPLLRAIRI